MRQDLYDRSCQPPDNGTQATPIKRRERVTVFSYACTAPAADSCGVLQRRSETAISPEDGASCCIRDRHAVWRSASDSVDDKALSAPPSRRLPDHDTSARARCIFLTSSAA